MIIQSHFPVTLTDGTYVAPGYLSYNTENGIVSYWPDSAAVGKDVTSLVPPDIAAEMTSIALQSGADKGTNIPATAVQIPATAVPNLQLSGMLNPTTTVQLDSPSLDTSHGSRLTSDSAQPILMNTAHWNADGTFTPEQQVDLATGKPVMVAQPTSVNWWLLASIAASFWWLTRKK